MGRGDHPCFMIDVELGSNLKIARLSDREFRCLITGVWALAAKARPRGYLAVAGAPANERDVAHQARCSTTLAKATLSRLRDLQMLELVEDLGLEYCHDWHTINPDPGSSTERMRRHRSVTNSVTSGVTEASQTASPKRHSSVTETSPEVKGKEKASPTEKNNTAELRSAAAECFAYWQEQCGHPDAQFGDDRRARLEARLRDRRKHHEGDLHKAILDVRQAIDGAAAGAFVNEQGKRFDDLTLICRNPSKLEDFMGRATLPAASARVIPMRRENASDWLREMQAVAVEDEESL